MPLRGDPSSPSAGLSWYNSVLSRFFGYDGTQQYSVRPFQSVTRNSGNLTLNSTSFADVPSFPQVTMPAFFAPNSVIVCKLTGSLFSADATNNQYVQFSLVATDGSLNVSLGYFDAYFGGGHHVPIAGALVLGQSNTANSAVAGKTLKVQYINRTATQNLQLNGPADQLVLEFYEVLSD